MTRVQLREVFNRHYGEAAQLARKLNVSRTSIYRWFEGHIVSAKIEKAVHKRAAQLIAKEEATHTTAAAVQRSNVDAV